MRLAFAVLGLAAVGCLMPPGSAERATDAARQLNLAARFGRMDVAVGLTTKELQPSFVQHRAAWGKDIRVLDVELTSFSMPSRDRANIEVDYSWSRMSESQLRTTRIAQEWRDNGRGFRLVRERRASGDLGLFGEAQARAETTPPPADVQFATKVIR